MVLCTERLILRPWQLSDAQALYTYAKDERVALAAGWPPHQSVEESLNIIQTIFMRDEVYAVTLKEDDRPIGLVGLSMPADSHLPLGDNDAEISFWLGAPYWGKGLIPEAVRELIRHSFVNLKLANLWSCYFDNNLQSKAVQEKCGLTYYGTLAPTYNELLGETKIEEISRITYAEWLAMKKWRSRCFT